ncbi:hypothetical protein [Bacteroides sedimenti]|uniref:Uncharacterized protein n=1 Tax=Bacteroides sedimenti TaxID=2136147 RepID=A0ABN6Z210_9BACE
MKRIASHYLYLSPDMFYKRQVVEIDQESFVRYFPLEEEIESVLWMPGILFLSSRPIDFNKIREAFKGSVGENLSVFLKRYSAPVNRGDVVSVFLITSVDLSSFTILPGSDIKKL